MKFDPNKDYYGILGVTPTAELAVIKAAYKALAAIYHPDKNSSNEAVTKMQAINEAWDILSNPSTRKKYDDAIRDKQPESDAFDEKNHSRHDDNASKDYFEGDWNFALAYYPDLAIYAQRLKKMGSRYEIAYKAQIVGGKDFSRGKEIAEIYEQGYLDTHFSTNPEIQEIAKKLIWSEKTRDHVILKELSIAVKTLGASDPDVIIYKFKHLKTKETIRTYATNSYTFLKAFFKEYRKNKKWQERSQYISVFLIIALLLILAQSPERQDLSIDIGVPERVPRYATVDELSSCTRIGVVVRGYVSADQVDYTVDALNSDGYSVVTEFARVSELDIYNWFPTIVASRDTAEDIERYVCNTYYSNPRDCGGNKFVCLEN